MIVEVAVGSVAVTAAVVSVVAVSLSAVFSLSLQEVKNIIETSKGADRNFGNIIVVGFW
jgi:hypothetical protein